MHNINKININIYRFVLLIFFWVSPQQLGLLKTFMLLEDDFEHIPFFNVYN